jgi:hypothetical protein
VRKWKETEREEVAKRRKLKGTTEIGARGGPAADRAHRSQSAVSSQLAARSDRRGKSGATRPGKEEKKNRGNKRRGEGKERESGDAEADQLTN